MKLKGYEVGNKKRISRRESLDLNKIKNQLLEGNTGSPDGRYREDMSETIRLDAEAEALRKSFVSKSAV